MRNQRCSSNKQINKEKNKTKHRDANDEDVCRSPVTVHLHPVFHASKHSSRVPAQPCFEAAVLVRLSQEVAVWSCRKRTGNYVIVSLKSENLQCKYN